MSKERAIELRLEGKSRRQIAAALGLKSGGEALNRWLKGVPAPEWTKRPNAKDDLRAQAVELRRRGHSYGEITAELGVPKSTLSDWLHDVLLETEAVERIAHLQHNGQQKGAAIRRAVRVARQREINAAARAQIPPQLADSELFVAGLAAYWAEGSKAKPWNVSESVRFINSDPDMIRLFLAWLALIGVASDRIGFRVSIHESGDADRATSFWAQQVGRPEAEFKRTTFKRHRQQGSRRLPATDYHGCLRIDVLRSTDLLRQIHGWWEGLVAAAVSVEAQSGMV